MKESIDKGKELFLAVWEGYWYNDDVKRKMYEYILCDDKFARMNRIDQAIFESEQEIDNGAETVDAEKVFADLEKKHFG